MIARYQELYSLCKIDLPMCPEPLLLQQLQMTGRDFCRFTESWRERLTMNLVDDQEDYVLSPNYDAEIIRPLGVWTNGDDTTADPDDPSFYDFTPSNFTLSFVSAPSGYDSIAADAWVTGTVYAVGDEVTNGNKTYECLTAHTANAYFAVDLASGQWEDITDDLIVKVVLLPRLFTTELAGWFMERWAEGIVSGAISALKSQTKKAWSDPDGAIAHSRKYDIFKALARRENFTENKQQDIRIKPQAWA